MPPGVLAVAFALNFRQLLPADAGETLLSTVAIGTARVRAVRAGRRAALAAEDALACERVRPRACHHDRASRGSSSRASGRATGAAAATALALGIALICRVDRRLALRVRAAAAHHRLPGVRPDLRSGGRQHHHRADGARPSRRRAASRSSSSRSSPACSSTCEPALTLGCRCCDADRLTAAGRLRASWRLVSRPVAVAADRARSCGRRARCRRRRWRRRCSSACRRPSRSPSSPRAARAGRCRRSATAVVVCCRADRHRPASRSLLEVCARRRSALAGAPGSTLASRPVWTPGGIGGVRRALGALFALYLRYVGREVTVVLIALCALITGLARAFDLRAALAGLAAGLVVQNVMGAAGDVLRDAIAQRRHAGARAVLCGRRRVDARRSDRDASGWPRSRCRACALVPAARRRRVRRARRRHRRAGDRLLWRALLPRRRSRSASPRWLRPSIRSGAASCRRWSSRSSPSIELVGPIMFRAALVEARRDRRHRRRARRRVQSRAVDARVRSRTDRSPRGPRRAACRSRSMR